jgi:hypothetical protein
MLSNWCKRLINATAQQVQTTRPCCRTDVAQGVRNAAAATDDPLRALGLWGYRVPGSLLKPPLFLSESGEDWWLYVNHARFMNRRGIYIDLATNNPVVISNTFFLDRCLGWKGLCIEPNPLHHSRIKQVRTCELVDKVMTTPGTHTVTMTSTAGKHEQLGGRTHVGMPTRKDRSRYPRHKLKKLEVTADTLGHTLAVHRIERIDFLSLDVEGHRSKDRLYLLYDRAARAARRHGAAELDAITISDAWPDETVDNRHFDGGHFMKVRQGTSAAVLNELLNMLSVAKAADRPTHGPV